MNVSINFADFVQIQETQPVTTSEFIAEAFGKRHADVLRKIDEVLTQVPDFFSKRNFALTEKTSKQTFGERVERAYQLTKDGFMLLVMGFTGKQAMQIKIAYIEAFNAMAEKLKQLSAPVDTRINAEQKQAIREAVDDRVARTSETHQGVYKKLHSLLRVNSYHEIQAKDFQTALSFLASIPNAPVKPKAEPQPNPNMPAIKRAAERMCEYFEQTAPAVQHLNRPIYAAFVEHYKVLKIYTPKLA